ncbi:hypothetical protein WMY93_028668 [Mugilogobius chulae]|uniref:Ig-like domain-containing protein n=1 Tax=Mugilogobius chulae TaxID=88201 RepID=A0AAW0MT40_9GOBI
MDMLFLHVVIVVLVSVALAVERERHSKNDCNDHKVLRNSTEGRSILHIPNFSYNDVGNYSCDTAYHGGFISRLNYVSIIAPPEISSWVEQSGDMTVAKCRAERASPPANISWTFTGNVTMETVLDSDGNITVTSSVVVNTAEEALNMSCIITHPYWDKPQVIVTNSSRSQASSQSRPAVYATVSVMLFCLVLLVLGMIKLKNSRRNQKSSKSPVDYVEEVEPYASYVQRVNSIYNSSRDLFV